MEKQRTQSVRLSFIANDVSRNSPVNHGQELIKDIEVELTPEAIFGWKLIGAWTDKVESADGKSGYADRVVEIVDDKDIDDLVGKILTVIDASIQDQEQRKALKTIMKTTIYGKYNAIRRSAGWKVNKENSTVWNSMLDD